ncbi:MAG: DUF5597 domain-containing protein, partial [Caulobacteraceae bacterium]
PVLGGLIIRLGPRDFLIAGKGVTITFRKPEGSGHAKLGIESLTEGHYEGPTWIVDRHLNGDQSNQGRFVRFGAEGVGLQRVTLYDYE